MHLPQTAEYALRALAFMASRSEAKLVRAETVAEETGVPLHYLHKVLRRLTTAGLLEAKKGPGGGFGLARAAEEICFNDVFVALDASLPNTCAFGWGACDAKTPCPLHGAYEEWKAAMRHWASHTTLANVRDYAPPLDVRDHATAAPRRLPVTR